MHREAINILEKHNFINEAAQILLSMNLPNRAGVIYAKHEMWRDAFNCFIEASLYREALICAQRLKDINLVLEASLQGSLLEEALQFCMAEGYFLEAARMCLKLDRTQDAVTSFKNYYLNLGDPSQHQLDEADVKFLLDRVAEDMIDEKLADVFAMTKTMDEAVIMLLEKDQLDKAGDFIRRSIDKTSESLLEKLKDQKELAPKLLELFESVSSFNLAAQLAEHLGMKKQAARNYERAEQIEKAHSLYVEMNEHADAKRLEELHGPFAEIDDDSEKTIVEHAS